ncbi:MAG: cobalamin biosynthesis protein [Candidatus Bathyarchaeota archaeon]|nr:cobalamin biosynthesis protein [Candidatus Termiticorpusculum sp.]MCL1971256.1 cobalamin biosynthesis protein [Candidatus Termiticorpusculum sp.]
MIAALLAISALMLAILLDLIIGDPSPWKPWKRIYNLHPIVWLGQLTKKLEPHFKTQNATLEKFNGILLALIIIGIITIPTYIGIHYLYIFFGAIAYLIIALVLFKLTICIKLETDGAIAVAKALEVNDLVEAKKYAHFSRRDSTNLSGPQIGSAVIESMVENLTDFKLSPFIYYAFFGLPGAVAFRAINTLDGMVGFKDNEHINTGWFSANLDNIVNYIPSRFTAVLMIISAALLGYDYKAAWQIAKRDHTRVQSRNHGWQMAAIAGALHIQLEKPGRYTVGDPLEVITHDKILKSLNVRDLSIVLCILIVIPVIIIIGLYLPWLWGLPL